MFAQMNVLGFKMTPWFEAQKYIENILKIFLFRTFGSGAWNFVCSIV